MSFRQGSEWVTIVFDPDGRIVERSVRFGMFGQIGRDIAASASSPSRGFELGAALIAAPSLYPCELNLVLRDALAIKLPENLCRWIPHQHRGAWCQSEMYSK